MRGVLRLLLAFPLALTMIGAGWATRTPRAPERPSTDNSYTKSEKAVPELPRLEERSKCDVRFAKPYYPERCMPNAALRDEVTVKYDISPEGGVTNAAVMETTNACFNTAALSFISGLQCAPKLGEAPIWKRSVENVVTFELAK